MNDLGQVGVQRNAAGLRQFQQNNLVVHDAENSPLEWWVNGLHVDVDVDVNDLVDVSWSRCAEVDASHREGVEVAGRGARTAGRRPGRKTGQ